MSGSGLAGATAQLDNKYSNLFNAQSNPINQQTAATVLASNNEIKADNEQYNNLYTGLNQQATDAANTQYAGNQTADTTVNQNSNRVNDIMAANGWLGGGENLQAQLNANSDRASALGAVNTAYTTALQGINTSRTADQNDQNTKLQALQSAISAANSNGASNINALHQSLNGQEASEISQEQAVYQAQQAAINLENLRASNAAKAAALVANAKVTATRATAAKAASSRSSSRSSGSSNPNPQASDMTGAIGSMMASQSNGNSLPTWINDPQNQASMAQLSQANRQSLMPNGTIYEHLLKGI